MRIVKPLLLWLLVVCALSAKTVTVTLLVTTDMHGNLFPYDFFTTKPAPRGLVKIATLIREARSENPNTVLVDCGDTIQGSPLETVYQREVRAAKSTTAGDPMMRVMNYLKYDAMVVGNHEYNFGLKNLSRARADAEFPWISANTRVTPGATNQPYAAYVVKEIAGVKVAIIGITTPKIPMWEEPANYKGYEFGPGKEAVDAALAEVKAKHQPDLVVVAVHAGLGRDLKTGAAIPVDLPGENMSYQLATEIPGVEAVVFGHTHSQLSEKLPNGVILLQPKNWAISLGRIDFKMDDAGGRWKVTDKQSRLIPVTDSTPVDEKAAAIGKPYFDAAERFLSSRVAQASSEMTTALSRVQDTALVDAIHTVQLHYAKADVSFTSAFNTGVRIPKGPVTVREIAALYLYENTLLALEGNGKMVREALENAARYFQQCSGDCSRGPLIGTKVLGFNYDMAQGVEYELDLTRPEGNRVRNLKFKGKPLADDQPLRIAVNNYRAGGSGGYTMFRDAKVLWRSSEEIRDMIIAYFSAKKVLPRDADYNWKIVPLGAAKELEREAAASVGNRTLQ